MDSRERDPETGLPVITYKGRKWKVREKFGGYLGSYFILEEVGE